MLLEAMLIGGAATAFVKFKRGKKANKTKHILSPPKIPPDETNNTSPITNQASPTPQTIHSIASNNNHKDNQYLTLSATSMITAGFSFALPVLLPISIALIGVLSIPVIMAAYQKWQAEKKLGHSALVTILTGIGLISGQILGLAIALFFYHYGVKKLSETQNESKTMLVDLFSQKPETVWVINEGIELAIPLDQVKQGDLLVVNTGDAVPVDGIIVEGMAIIDQQALTGESQPAEKLPQQTVLASTQVVSGRIIIQVTKTGNDTVVAQVGNMLNQSADYKVSVLSKGEKWADQMATPLIVSSTILSPAIGMVGVSGVLNSSFGNRLQLAAPQAVLNHLNLATQKGILIKDGRALEKIPQVDTILFDKTGTLTEEQPQVGHIFTCADDYNAQRLLAEAAAAEMKLAHPIAKAIVNQAKIDHLTLPDIHDADFQIGLGVSVKIEENTIRVGSLRFMQQNDLIMPIKLEAQLDSAYQQGYSIIFLAANNEIKGAIEIQPTIRPKVKPLMKSLRQQGISYLAIVSGDHEKPTQALAQQLDMDHYFAEVMPEEKAAIIKQLQQQGKTVCFIGDGINDSMAIQQADVSISLDGATHIARDLAQIIFMDNNLERLSDLLTIAASLEKCLHNTLKTLYAPVFINLTGTFLFGFGLLTTVLINNASLLLALKKSQQTSLIDTK
jgi:heavy metal translocating P-type ATPase